MAFVFTVQTVLALITTLVVGAFAFKFVGKVKKTDALKVVTAVVAVITLMSGFGAIPNYIGEGTALTAGATNEDNVVVFKEEGVTSTVVLNAFEGSWSGVATKTEVYPQYTILNKAGNIVVDGANANSTTSTVGEELSIYGTGSSYYVDTKLSQSIDNAGPVIELQAYAISARTDLQITIEDSNGDALTADDNSNNTADYAGGNLGAGEETIYVAKLQNKVADKVVDLSLICTYNSVGQEIDDFMLDSAVSASPNVALPSFTEVAIPKALKSASITAYDDVNASTSITFQRCYEASSPVRLQEWEFIKIQYTIDTDDSTGPSANGDSYVGAVYMDASNYKDTNGAIQSGAYAKGDGTESPEAVGMDEDAITVHTGLDTAFQIEAQ